MKLKHLLGLFVIITLFMNSGCGSSSSSLFTNPDTDNQNQNQNDENQNDNQDTDDTSGYLKSADIDVKTQVSNSADGGHVISADGVTTSYANYGITKTGDSSGEEADFYGDNSAVFATNGANLTLKDSLIVTNGQHANAVFSYGEGTVVNVQDSVIITSGNNSGGIMTTGGGTMNATNLTIETSGRSSAAIRSDRGGGTVNVTGGSYTATGRGSPAIYSTANITVTGARLVSGTAQGVVIEGKNSVTLNSSDLTADNNTHNSDNSTRYQAVMIYQSGSGDASEGKGTFVMTGGKLTNKNGDIFFVNNTAADVTLNNVDITNEDDDGVFLRAEAAGWGTSGSNGGKLNLHAIDQAIDSDIIVDSISVMNLYLSGDVGSELYASVNESNSGGKIYVEIREGSTWTLTGDSYITSLTCNEESISLNGHTLYVNGTEYTEGSASSGTAIDISTRSR